MRDAIVIGSGLGGLHRPGQHAGLSGRVGVWAELRRALHRESHSSDDYAAFKDWVAQRLPGQFKCHFPALASMVRFYEAATPLTQRRFVHAVDGSMDGVELSLERPSRMARFIDSPAQAW
jgi:phytoene dehydrogenase-like protein